MHTLIDERFCPVAAFLQQSDLVGNNGLLFRSCTNTTAKMGAKVTTYASYRGVASWVGGLIGRPKLTVKDIGRRVAMTKLANSDIPLEDCCKYMGVTAKTMSIYQRPTLGIELRAARLLGAYSPNKPNTTAAGQG